MNGRTSAREAVRPDESMEVEDVEQREEEEGRGSSGRPGSGVTPPAALANLYGVTPLVALADPGGETPPGARKEGEEEPRRIGKEEEGGRMRNIGDPRMPSAKEVEEHNITHVPYRNWCPHCVRGRGKELDHRRALEDDRKVREFSFDYCFPGDEKGSKITVLVGRERVTGMTMASVVPVKGTSGQFAAMKVLEFIRECGAAETEIILKSDQEPAIEALVADVVKTRGAKITMVEKSPVGSSGSNGVVERGVQSVEGMIRTLRSACEARLGIKIKPEEKIVIFMAEYAAYLVNRLEVGKDGKTAYERCRGKKATVMAVEFGERLLWKVRPKNKMEKLNVRWEYGVFVGVKAVSGEMWVATKTGLQAVRSVRRVPAEDRWAAENKDWVKHVPWNKSGDDPDADGELPESPEAVEDSSGGRVSDAGASGDQPRVVVVNTRETAPRDFYIKKKDVETHGHTKGCPGCRTMFLGGTRQAHTAECRERFRMLMKDEEKVARTREKRKEFEERMEEEAKRKEEKKQRKEERRTARGGSSCRPSPSGETQQGGGRPGRADLRGVTPPAARADLRGETPPAARGKKRGADDDDLDEERVRRGAVEENKGEEEQDEEMQEEERGEQAASSSKDVLVQEVTGDDEEAWDDVRGGKLDRGEVRKARMEEVGYMKKKGLWEVVPRERARGQRIVSVKWVDTNKGTEEQPQIRCRLVARDFRAADKDREDLFAATPPWELKKLLMSQATNRAKGKVRKMLLIDVKKAHLNPECTEDVFIELPDMRSGSPL